jgi:hypothetical protein
VGHVGGGPGRRGSHGDHGGDLAAGPSGTERVESVGDCNRKCSQTIKESLCKMRQLLFKRSQKVFLMRFQRFEMLHNLRPIKSYAICRII